MNPALKLPSGRAATALQAVKEFRKAWKAELARLVSGDKLGDGFIGRLNRSLAEDSFHEELRHEETKGFRLVRSSSQLAGEKLALAILARQIAGFLAEADLAYLHRCANTASCTLYFYDTTKNHRRQWCSGTACGNRHKVAQFRKRQAKTAT